MKQDKNVPPTLLQNLVNLTFWGSAVIASMAALAGIVISHLALIGKIPLQTDTRTIDAVLGVAASFLMIAAVLKTWVSPKGSQRKAHLWLLGLFAIGVVALTAKDFIQLLPTPSEIVPLSHVAEGLLAVGVFILMLTFGALYLKDRKRPKPGEPLRERCGAYCAVGALICIVATVFSDPLQTLLGVRGYIMFAALLLAGA